MFNWYTCRGKITRIPNGFTPFNYQIIKCFWIREFVRGKCILFSYLQRQVKDIISTLYTCSPLDDNDDDLDLTNESNNSDVQQTPTNGEPPDSGSPSKKRKAESEVERYYKFKPPYYTQDLK